MSEREADGLRSRVYDAAQSNLVNAPLIAVVGLVATIVVARVLGPHDFAVYAVVIAFRGAAQFLSDMGTGAAATRAFAELHAGGARRQALRVYVRLGGIRVGLAAALVAGLLGSAGPLRDLMGIPADEAFVLRYAAAVGAAEVLSSLGYYVLAGSLQHRVLNRILLAAGVLQPLLVVVGAAAGLGLSGILAGLLVGSLIRGLGLNAAALVGVLRIEESGARIEQLARSYVRTATGSITGKFAAWVHSRQLWTVFGFANFPRAEVSAYSLAYDTTHQVLTILSSPVYALLLPTFSSLRGEGRDAGRAFRESTRLIALVVAPTGAIMLAAFPTLAAALFGPGFEGVTSYALIFVPACVVEFILSGPATALMLSRDDLLPAYRRIKALTLLAAAAYVLLVGWSLIALSVFMMSVRTASAVALHVSIRRRAAITLDAGWLPPLAAVSLGSAAAVVAARLIVPGAVAELVVAAVLTAVALVWLVRMTGLITAEDVRLAESVLPARRKVVRRLARLAGVPAPSA